MHLLISMRIRTIWEKYIECNTTKQILYFAKHILVARDLSLIKVQHPVDTPNDNRSPMKCIRSNFFHSWQNCCNCQSSRSRKKKIEWRQLSGSVCEE